MQTENLTSKIFGHAAPDIFPVCRHHARSLWQVVVTVFWVLLFGFEFSEALPLMYDSGPVLVPVVENSLLETDPPDVILPTERSERLRDCLNDQIFDKKSGEKSSSTWVRDLGFWFRNKYFGAVDLHPNLAQVEMDMEEARGSQGTTPAANFVLAKFSVVYKKKVVSQKKVVGSTALGIPRRRAPSARQNVKRVQTGQLPVTDAEEKVPMTDAEEEVPVTDTEEETKFEYIRQELPAERFGYCFKSGMDRSKLRSSNLECRGWGDVFGRSEGFLAFLKDSLGTKYRPPKPAAAKSEAVSSDAMTTDAQISGSWRPIAAGATPDPLLVSQATTSTVTNPKDKNPPVTKRRTKTDKGKSETDEGTSTSSDEAKSATNDERMSTTNDESKSATNENQENKEDFNCQLYSHSEQALLGMYYLDAKRCALNMEARGVITGTKVEDKENSCNLMQAAKDGHWSDHLCSIELFILDAISMPNSVCVNCDMSFLNARFFHTYKEALAKYCSDKKREIPNPRLVVRTTSEVLFSPYRHISCAGVNYPSIISELVEDPAPITLHKLPPKLRPKPTTGLKPTGLKPTGLKPTGLKPTGLKRCKDGLCNDMKGTEATKATKATKPRLTMEARCAVVKTKQTCKLGGLLEVNSHE